MQPQSATTDYLKHLRGLMLRTDLLPAEKLICWYLLAELTNRDTGLCYCSNKHLAKTLSLNLRTIQRSKNSLREKSVLTWRAYGSGPQTATSASCYRFIQVGAVHRPLPSDTQTATPAVHRPLRGSGPQTARTKPETSKLPKTDPATDRRIANGLAQLATKLKAGDIIAPLDDAADFQNWKTAWQRQ